MIGGSSPKYMISCMSSDMLIERRESALPRTSRANDQKAPLTSAPRSMHAPVSVIAGSFRFSMNWRSSTPPSSSTHTNVMESAVPCSSSPLPGLEGFRGGEGGGGKRAELGGLSVNRFGRARSSACGAPAAAAASSTAQRRARGRIEPRERAYPALLLPLAPLALFSHFALSFSPPGLLSLSV
eukprot:scaffold217999_cov35-Tisochrysis_lutea.AAC.4